MGQYFLNCLECARTLELDEREHALCFNPLCLLENEETLGGFLLLHRGHPLVFTTKE